jgi:hypothetical protein
MGTITGFTSARMLSMENATVIDGTVVGNDLILETKGGTLINAGNVRGIQGIQGVPGEITEAELNAAIAPLASSADLLAAANAVDAEYSRAEIGHISQTLASTSFTTVITNLNVATSVNLDTPRSATVMVTAYFESTVAGDAIKVFIYKNGVQDSFDICHILVANSQTPIRFFDRVYLPAGATSLDLRAVRYSGSGTCVMAPTSNFNSYIHIVDNGLNQVGGP